MASPADISDGHDGERIIDRSGDIDQRPPDERAGIQTSGALAFPRVQHRELVSPTRYTEPSPERTVPPSLSNLAARLQKDLDKHYTKAKAQLDQLDHKIEAQEKRCLPPKLDEDLQQIRFQRQKILIANGPALSAKLSEERARLADLEHFKTKNRLVRDAHYPSSPVLGLGILFCLMLAEGGINGIFFADTSDQGLLGGWLEAFVLSCTNVGPAFLLGRLAIPQMHSRNLAAKMLGLILTVSGLVAIACVNLAGAHYRDFRAALAAEPAPPSSPKKEIAEVHPSPKASVTQLQSRKIQPLAPAAATAAEERTAPKMSAKERNALAEIFKAPFAFDSFMSLFLFVAGLCGATIAAADGYRFDDPFPGYGRRHRSHQDARAARTEALNRILHQSNAIMTGHFQAISRKLEAFAQEMTILLALHHAYSSDQKSLSDCLKDTVEDADAEIAAHERLQRRVRESGPHDFFALSLRQLPPLGEKHVKFYEAQERKLKALQKSAQKEQSDLLGIFDEASADFQRLLAECSQASFSAAGISSPRESA